jgi:hypothetical protein
MDHKKFLNLLKNLQNIMRCPSCSAVYDMSEVQYVGNHDGHFLLSMTCSKCSLPVWVNFYSGGPGQIQPVTDLTINDIGLLSKGPITKDEVIDFHKFLKTFSGDFKEKLK